VKEKGTTTSQVLAKVDAISPFCLWSSSKMSPPPSLSLSKNKTQAKKASRAAIHHFPLSLLLLA
jgi:hypothetical protein